MNLCPQDLELLARDNDVCESVSVNSLTKQDSSLPACHSGLNDDRTHTKDVDGTQDIDGYLNYKMLEHTSGWFSSLSCPPLQQEQSQTTRLSSTAVYLVG